MTFCFLNWQVLSRKAPNSQQVCAVLPVDVEEQKELNLSLRFGAGTGWSLLDGLVSCGPNGAADRKGRINLSNESDNNHRRQLQYNLILRGVWDVLRGADALVTLWKETSDNLTWDEMQMCPTIASPKDFQVQIDYQIDKMLHLHCVGMLTLQVVRWNVCG